MSKEPSLVVRLTVRCLICGRFVRSIDRLVAEASDWRVAAHKRHYHTRRSHKP